MKKYTAIYRQSKTGMIENMVREYENKKLFIEDLRGNGLRVLAVLSDKDILDIKGNECAGGRRMNYCGEYVRQVL